MTVAWVKCFLTQNGILNFLPLNMIKKHIAVDWMSTK